jgi:transcription elongation factor Elf1
MMNCVICGSPNSVDTPVCATRSTVQPVCNVCFFQVIIPLNNKEQKLNHRQFLELAVIERNHWANRKES